MKTSRIFIKEVFPILIAGCLLLPFVIAFMDTLEELGTIGVPDIIYYPLIFLLSAFVVAFFYIGLIDDAVESDQNQGIQDFEEEDLVRLSLQIKKALMAFSITTLIWVALNLYIIQNYSSEGNRYRLIYILCLPLAVNIFLLYAYRKSYSNYQ